MKLVKDQYRSHFNRWLDLYDRLPIDYVELVTKEIPTANPKHIKQVANGRRYDFAILDVLETVTSREEMKFFKRQKIKVY